MFVPARDGCGNMVMVENVTMLSGDSLIWHKLWPKSNRVSDGVGIEEQVRTLDGCCSSWYIHWRQDGGSHYWAAARKKKKKSFTSFNLGTKTLYLMFQPPSTFRWAFLVRLFCRCCRNISCTGSWSMERNNNNNFPPHHCEVKSSVRQTCRYLWTSVCTSGGETGSKSWQRRKWERPTTNIPIGSSKNK